LVKDSPHGPSLSIVNPRVFEQTSEFHLSNTAYPSNGSKTSSI